MWWWFCTRHCKQWTGHVIGVSHITLWQSISSGTIVISSWLWIRSTGKFYMNLYKYVFNKIPFILLLQYFITMFVFNEKIIHVKCWKYIYTKKCYFTIYLIFFFKNNYGNINLWWMVWYENKNGFESICINLELCVNIV